MWDAERGVTYPTCYDVLVDADTICASGTFKLGEKPNHPEAEKENVRGKGKGKGKGKGRSSGGLQRHKILKSADPGGQESEVKVARQFNPNHCEGETL